MKESKLTLAKLTHMGIDKSNYIII